MKSSVLVVTSKTRTQDIDAFRRVVIPRTVTEPLKRPPKPQQSVFAIRLRISERRAGLFISYLSEGIYSDRWMVRVGIVCV